MQSDVINRREQDLEKNKARKATIACFANYHVCISKVSFFVQIANNYLSIVNKNFKSISGKVFHYYRARYLKRGQMH